MFYKQNNIYRPDFRTASLRITDFLLEDEFVFSEKWNNNETIFKKKNQWWNQELGLATTSVDMTVQDEDDIDLI